MNSRIEKFEEELREVAALEMSLYSVVPGHGSSAHKVRTPAWCLSRLYIHACKYWTQGKKATIAKIQCQDLYLLQNPAVMMFQGKSLGLLPLIYDWKDTSTFTQALEKIESWIFTRIVESVWWQVSSISFFL